MAYFAVNYLYSTDADLVASVRPKHREYLRSLVDKGVLKASGPLVGAERDSALLILEDESVEAVREALSHDPMMLNDVVEESSVTEWNPVLGVFS